MIRKVSSLAVAAMLFALCLHVDAQQRTHPWHRYLSTVGLSITANVLARADQVIK